MRDHNTAVWDILMKGRIGETYLIGADGETNNRDVVQFSTSSWVSIPMTMTMLRIVRVHDLRYAIDNTKLREELGWEPRFTDFRSGLANTIEWYTANEAWWAPLKDEVEARSTPPKDTDR